MKVTQSILKDCFLIEPKIFGDERGYFLETYQYLRYSEFLGPQTHFVQDNLSKSEKGVLRGLHFQNPKSQGKLVSVVVGEVYDVVVDLRLSSPTFGKSFGVYLNDKKHTQMWVPNGFAHGFLVTSEFAIFSYKVTSDYIPNVEQTLLYNDPSLTIEWPKQSMTCTLSQKDLNGKSLAQLKSENLLFE